MVCVCVDTGVGVPGCSTYRYRIYMGSVDCSTDVTLLCLFANLFGFALNTDTMQQ